MRRDILHNYLGLHADSPVCAYLYDVPHLEKRAEYLREKLPSQCKMFYAVKANSDAQVLGAINNRLDGFEVASLGEIEKVRAVDKNVPIIFGGPCKTDAELEGAILHDVMLIHVESEHQLKRLNWIACSRNKVVDILLRVNPSTMPTNTEATLRMGGEATQFGIDQGQISSMIALSMSLPGIHLKGLHIHALSNNLNADNHLLLLQHYLNLAAFWEKEHRIKFDWLNVGGGIGVNYRELDNQFDWQGFCTGLAGLFETYTPELNIVFECGRFVTADCGYYLSEVADVKTTHGKNFAILRGGSHHFRLPASWQHNHPFVVLRRDKWKYPFDRPGLKDAQITLCGELCTPKDTLARDVHVEEIRAGDCIVFLLAGAYGWHISHHDFLSHPHPERCYLYD
ncbi:MAG TPA: type III PLP-dependent enzyme [Oxalicibacterium sp.]|uniref:type III PLP-dependent enzyme n=1 Tax=Oxalicibacterium sp. TaxID=2766525 RepID=UPI002D131239|nr:type III PLP-dependent enzyme [Oxalicibacterium sp.]HWU97132.1 type III PLP-dependent enzyme [Oxalicibacterium sp.]